MGSSFGSLPITASARILYNPDIDDLIFMMPMLSAILMQLLSFNMTATSMSRERELGTIEQILVTPARPMELMLSKIVPNIGLTALVTLVLIVAGVYWFKVPFHGSVWLFAWLSILFIIAGSLTFSQILQVSGATTGLLEQIQSWSLTPFSAILIMMLILLFLGAFMDQVSILLIR